MEPAPAELPPLVIQRIYPASCQTVYDAWTHRAALEQWFAPEEGMTIRVLELELHEGGRYRIEMVDTDGVTSHTVNGRFEVVDPPNQLVFTWAWEPHPGERPLDYAPCRVIVDLEAVGEGTRLTLTHQHLPSQPLIKEHESGWHGCLARLGDRVADSGATW